ncbi:MAG: alpha/beta fold hydrolase [Pseudorhodobacter sp.]
MTDPLVLLPGLMADARVFLPQILALGADRAVTVAPLLGDTVEDMSAAALNGLPERFALAGQGLGGIVALDVLRRAPERLSRLVLIATDPLGDGPQAVSDRDRRIILARTGRLTQAMEAELPSGAIAAVEAREEILWLVQEMAAALGEECYVAQARALQRRRDQQKTLRKAKLPILVLAGAEDMVVSPRRQGFMVDLAPTARLKTIEGAGHLPTLESPDAVTHAMRAFLAGPLLLR